MFRGLNSLSRKLVLPAVLVALVGVSDAYAAGPGLYGHVLGQGEDGDLQGVIPDAEVQFLRGNAVVAEATTNASGYYKVNLAPGPYTYRVRASGYKSDDAGRRMRLQRSTGYVVRDFILVKGQDPPDRVKPNPVEVGLLTGRVITKTAKGDVGVAGASITLRAKDERKAETTVSSRQQDQRPPGHYEIGLSPGSYRVTVRAKGFERLIDLDPIEIAPGASVSRDFVLHRVEADGNLEQGIRGRVSLLTQAAAQKPPTIIDVSVIRSPANKLASEAVKLDREGNFDHPLPPGRYRLAAQAKGYRDAVSQPVYVFPNRYSKLSLTLRPLPTADQRVVFDVKVFDETTLALLADAHLQIRHAESRTTVSGTTDVKGHVSLGIDTPGTLTIEVERAGYERWSQSSPWAEGKHPLMIALKKSADTPITDAAQLLVTVVDAETDQPLVKTDLILRRSDQPLASAKRGQTDEKGQRTFNDCLPGDYIVAARAKGYRTGGQRVQIKPESSQSLRVELLPVRTPPTSELVAMVFHDGSTVPIPGVSISIEQGDIVRRTDSSGRATIPLTQAGIYTVIAQSQGFVSQKQGVKFDPAVKMGPVVFHLKKQSPVTTGFTFAFVDAKSRAPLADVRAELHKQGMRAFQRTTSSDKGEARFRSEGAGSYDLRAQLQGYQPLARSLTLSPEKNEIEIALDRTTSPTMYKVQTLVSDSQKRTAIQGAEVSITPSGPRAVGAIRERTGIKGDALLSVSQPGIYMLRVDADGYRSAQRAVQVAPDRPLTTVEIPLESTPTPTTEVDINGFVVSQTPSGRLGFAGIPGATVRWQRADNVSRSVTSARMGRFSITLPPGVYDVTVQPPSGSDYLATTEKAISIRDAAPRKPIYLRLARKEVPPTDTPDATRVTGYCRALDSAGQPTQKGIPDTYLTWMASDGKRQSTRTDQGGRYQLELQPGSYTVTVTPPKGFLPTKQRVVIQKVATERNLYVRTTTTPQQTQKTKLSIEVRLRHPDGRRTLPMAGAVVEVQQNNKTIASAKSGRDGRCPPFQVAPGTYRVRATAKGYGDDIKTLTVPRQGLSTSLTLTPPSVD